LGGLGLKMAPSNMSERVDICKRFPEYGFGYRVRTPGLVVAKKYAEDGDCLRHSPWRTPMVS
jgi:hypothetical protein